MKKKLFGLLLFSLILSSLAYAKIRETGNQGGTQNITEATIVKLSPEEEKEAYKALERVRKRIEKEDKEREEALKLAEKQAQEEAKRIEEAKAQAQAEEQLKQVQEVVVQESQNNVTEVTTASGLTPKEEKEAYKALERARKRIEKENKERAEALKLAEEQARAQIAQ